MLPLPSHPLHGIPKPSIWADASHPHATHKAPQFHRTYFLSAGTMDGPVVEQSSGTSTSQATASLPTYCTSSFTARVRAPAACLPPAPVCT